MKYLKTYESVHDTKDWIEEVISNCKDIMLEISDIFYNSEVTKKYVSDERVYLPQSCRNTIVIDCKFVAGPFNKSTKKRLLII